MAAALTKLLLLVAICSLGSACQTGDLRVRNGSVNTEGRIELCSDSVWGTVCHDHLDYQGRFGSATSIVVCRQLGFALQGAKFIRGPNDGGLFPAGTGEIHLDQIMCNGSENALIDCPHDGVGAHDCEHDNDAGIQCNGHECIDGAVRLVDGSIETEGRVELCMSGAWSTVSADNWGVEEATVVCRQLGMTGEGDPMPSSSFGPGVGPIMNVTCTGSEDNLQDCTMIDTGHNYDHTNDAGVFCSGGPTTQASSTQQPDEPTSVEPTDSTENTSDSTTQTVTMECSNSTATPTAGQTTTEVPLSETEEDSFDLTMLWGIVATLILVGGASTLLGVALVWACARARRKRGMINVDTRHNRSRRVDYIEGTIPINNLETSLHVCDAYGRRTDTLEHPVKLVNCKAYGSSEKPNNLDVDSGIMLQSNGDPEYQRYSELEVSYDYIHDYEYINTLRRDNTMGVIAPVSV